MDPRELIFWPAHRMAAAVRERTLSSADLVEAHLAWLSRRNPALNAVVTLDEAGARARAREADAALAAGQPHGPLHGVPVTIKDIYDVAGMRTTYGYRPTARNVATRHATVVQRLMDAGAIVLGKTNIPELSFDWQCLSPIFGRTVNPWDATRTPGGSSGGSAAAVAAGLSPLDIGSDVAGSLRVPAHYCGVYTIKPTENRIPGTGHGELPGMLRGVRHATVFGPVARSVEDLALSLSLLEGPDGLVWEVPPPPPVGAVPGSLSECRFAYSEELGVPVSEEVKAVLRDTVARLERAGAHVERCAPPDFDMEAALETWGGLVGSEMGACMPWHLRLGWRLIFTPRYGRSAWTRGYVRGLNDSLRFHTRALEARDALASKLDAFLSKWTAWLCPVSSTVAFTHRRIGTPIEVDGRRVPYTLAAGAYASVFSVSGNPVVGLPAGLTQGGLPVGLQLVGRRWKDAELLGIARLVDATLPGFQRPPEP
jgi:amidase